MPEPIIKTEKLNIVFEENTPRENHVLKDISIDIYPGEYVILFGPSGCGKSTLLYHLAGMDRNFKDGKIILDGEDITKIPEQDVLEIRKKKIGMVFQAYNLITTVKVIHNVALPYYFQEKNNKETIKQAEKHLDMLGVLSQKDKFPPALSGGQQQRVAIARALITDPDIIFADEPVGNLDFKSAYDVLNIISDLNIKQKKTIVFVTHDMNYLQFADKIIYLWDGGVSKVEINRRKLTPTEKFGDIKKNKISQFTQRLASSLVSFILVGKEKDVLGKRVEGKLVDFLTHNTSWEGLISFFSSPIRLGGLGFSYTRVKKMEEVLKKMRIQNNLLFFKYFNKIDKNDIVDVICQEVDCGLDIYQKQRLANMIELTMSGIVDEKNIHKFLIAPLKDKGLNISEGKAGVLNDKIQIFLDLLATVKTSKENTENKDLSSSSDHADKSAKESHTKKEQINDSEKKDKTK